MLKFIDKKRFLGASLTILLATLSNTNFSYAESLSEALRAVSQNNPKLDSERAKFKGEIEKIPQAKSGFLPQISLQGDVGQLYNRNLLNNVSQTTKPMGAGLGFSQPIFNGFRTMGDYQRAQDEVLASKSTYLNAEQTSYLYGAQAYLRVLRDRRILGLRHENLRNLRSQLAQAQTRFKAGDMTLTNVDQTRARLAEAEADIAQSQADIADSEAYYRYIIGHSPSKLRMPALSKINLPCSVNDAIDVSLNDNPQVQAAAHLNRASDGIIKSAKSAHYPQLSLDGSYRRGNDESRVLGSKAEEATVGLKLSVPVYSGGLHQSRIRQAEALKEQRTKELYDTKNNAIRMVSSSWDGLRSSKLRKFASNQRVKANNAALYGLTIEFKAGQIPLIQVLDGRREVANAQVALAVSEFDESMQVFNLLAAVGHLDLNAIDAISAGKSFNSSRACARGMAVGSIKKAQEPVLVIGKPLKPADKLEETLTVKTKDKVQPNLEALKNDDNRQDYKSVNAEIKEDLHNAEVEKLTSKTAAVKQAPVKHLVLFNRNNKQGIGAEKEIITGSIKTEAHPQNNDLEKAPTLEAPLSKQNANSKAPKVKVIGNLNSSKNPEANKELVTSAIETPAAPISVPLSVSTEDALMHLNRGSGSKVGAIEFFSNKLKNSIKVQE